MAVGVSTGLAIAALLIPAVAAGSAVHVKLVALLMVFALKELPGQIVVSICGVRVMAGATNTVKLLAIVQLDPVVPVTV